MKLFKKYPIRTALCALLLPAWAAVKFMENPLFVERYIVNGPIGRGVKPLMARLFSSLPFSLAEVLVLCAGILALFYITLSIRAVALSQYRWETLYGRLATIVAVAGALYLLFALLWGIYYYRPTLAERENISMRAISVEELYKVTDYIVTELNRTAGQVARRDDGIFDAEGYKNTFASLNETCRTLTPKYPFLEGLGTPKPVMLSELMNWMNITGIYFPYTHESNVNVASPDLLLAATAAHELSHQAGIAREDEANYMAYVICSESTDSALSYSGNSLAFMHLSNALSSADPALYRELTARIDPAVWADLRYYRAFWQKYQGTLEKVSSHVNDRYLMAHAQVDGVKSYGRMIDLLAARILPLTVDNGNAK